MASRAGSIAKKALSCRQPLRLSKTSQSQFSTWQARAFTPTSPVYKKKNHQKVEPHAKYNPQDLKDSSNSAETTFDKAFDFSKLESEILKSIERMTHKLSELRSGGRLNPTQLEGLSVKLDKASSNTIKLKEIAQVVTKGQYIHVILSDETHIKPTKSAILSSSLNVAPQDPEPDSPTTITLKIPPQTGESRQVVVEEVKKASNQALDQVKRARHDKHDTLRDMLKDKSLRKDDYQKAHDEMEKVVKKGNEEVKRIADGAKRVFEG